MSLWYRRTALPSHSGEGEVWYGAAADMCTVGAWGRGCMTDENEGTGDGECGKLI